MRGSGGAEARRRIEAAFEGEACFATACRFVKMVAKQTTALARSGGVEVIIFYINTSIRYD